MAEIETIVNTESKSVAEWAESKKTDRWLLCLAVTAQAWLPEQEDDAQDYLTEAEYDAAIDAAKQAHEKAKREYGRERVRTVLHDTLYIGFVVRRFGANELASMQRTIDDKPAKEGGQLVVNNFKGVILYPEALHLDRLRDIVGQAAVNVLPLKWLASLGAEGERRAKKR